MTHNLQKRGVFTQALINAAARRSKREAKEEGFVGAIEDSYEIDRVCSIPRRDLDFDGVLDLTPVFRKPEGTWRLRPIQSAALLEANYANGLFAPIAVGAGKSLILYLLAEAMDSQKTVLLVPPQLRDKLKYELDEVYGKHFNIPMDRITRVIAYSELSLAKNSELLHELEPDLIAADECHFLRRIESARTKRFMRYMDDNTDCRFAGLSGTMTQRSIMDYAHLLRYALRHNSTLPESDMELAMWAGALDVTPSKPMKPGALMKLCKQGETVRQGYRRRLVQTTGVVATEEGAVGNSLYVRSIDIPVPQPVHEALEAARRSWSYNEEEFASPLEMARFLKQIACGFYYRWVWPGGDADTQWLEARAAWKRAARELIQQNLPGLDSELLVSNAAERWYQAKFEGREFKEGVKFFECEEWIEWRAVKGRYKPHPPTETVWIDDFLARDAIEKAKTLIKKGRKVIIWYSHRALGERIEEISRWPHFGSGSDASLFKEDVMICSVATQGTGKNLQHYDANIITSLPPSGKMVEQLLGRTHRPGQMSDDVIADWYAHTKEMEMAMDAVVADARYIQETTGQKQKILYATSMRLNAQEQ